MRFHRKIAFITGGATGLGRAFARALTGEGASVAIADIDRAAADRAAAELTAEGARAIAVTCDVADEQQVDAAVGLAIQQLGGIDILINNAGRHLTKYNQPFSVLSRDDIRELFEVNVIGVINCTLACRDSMRERGGGVVLNISSMAGFMNVSPYGVSKLAVRGLTVAFASELSPDRIRVNAIAPGLTNTENALADLPHGLVDDIVRERQLVHRLGTTDDVVSAMLYLCSDDSSFITGETLKVSGGYPLNF
ncbi:SDR family NAD(P)-dependent oxidoreductase [Mycobacterium xenopi]|uniref:Oxidoreductase n=1 Tax=Mycobacterium xenopi TaxID=1789 RepID=A0AAD1M3J6_MYCXE|nr:glucose 1-dehydrogenase [Mycobacterium xenopi]EUA43369.1 short chain dehydrogenase family protein [Mycobacterium xenopi 3993]EID12596.1 short chain dehydrogenase/reductase [Mycobacterium xenopi RIVM700367]MDA3641096.1 glucose 1-dehydrogenase [Mycobacterium xenopi]MDA3656550.1 glucose 1-dehydrogenase [Mycobacterium xenopi]MDA3662941.1 glucose 1-dehydrogenase [Mycobacterium xenopi]